MRPNCWQSLSKRYFRWLNYQLWSTKHLRLLNIWHRLWCDIFGHRIVDTICRWGISSHQAAIINCQWDVSCHQTANTSRSRVIYHWIVGIDHWSRVSRHWIADASHGTQSPNIGLMTLVVEVESLTIKPLSPVTGEKSSATTAIIDFWSEVPNH